MDGFGAALTESSAHLLMQLEPAARTAALRSLFDPVAGAGIDLVRLPLGASDFALSRYTYDDLPAGPDGPDPEPVLARPRRRRDRAGAAGGAADQPGAAGDGHAVVGPGVDEDQPSRWWAARCATATPTSTPTTWSARSRRCAHGSIPIRFLTLGNEPKYAPRGLPRACC